MRIWHEWVLASRYLATHSDHHSLLLVLKVLVNVFIFNAHRVFIIHFFIFTVCSSCRSTLYRNASRLLVYLIIHPLSCCLVPLLFLKGLLYVSLIGYQVELVVCDATFVHLTSIISRCLVFLAFSFVWLESL